MAADQKYALAQANLGMIYTSRQGVPQDYTEAVKWERLAAEQGEATAQSNLGMIYAKGQGLAQDYKEALNWFRRSAEQKIPARK